MDLNDLQLRTLFGLLNIFDLNVTDESFVDETHVWRKSKIIVLVSMMSLFIYLQILTIFPLFSSINPIDNKAFARCISSNDLTLMLSSSLSVNVMNNQNINSVI